MKRIGAALTAILLSAMLVTARDLHAQAVGDEFQVNTYTTGAQFDPAAAMAANGDFVVVWESDGSADGDTSGPSVQARRYASDGTARGASFQVNAHTPDRQGGLPRVASEPDGDFVVVWTSGPGSPGGDTFYSVQGRCYASDGTPRGDEFQVNTYTTGVQDKPAVGVDSLGAFVVVWQSHGAGPGDTWGRSIQARRFASDGSPTASQFQVNTYTTNAQSAPAVAVEADGDFVVLWHGEGWSPGDPSSGGVLGQRYAADGTWRGSQFQVNSGTPSSPAMPSVAAHVDGGFVAAWSGFSAGDDYGVQARRFAADGSPVGGDFRVNGYTPGVQYGASVAIEADGDFVVAWSSEGSPGADTDVRSPQAQRYASDGTARGTQFQVNVFTPGFQARPMAVTGPSGGLLMVWASDASQDGDGWGVLGRRFSFLPTVSLGDGSVTEGDSGRADVSLTAVLSESSSATVTALYSTVDGTAIGGIDYKVSSGTVSFAAGETSRTFNVGVWGDVRDEPVETFFVNLHTPVGATIADGQAAATIVDNDPPAALSVSDQTSSEGDTGYVGANFTVTLAQPSGKTVAVDWATAPGSAIPGDYRTQSGTLSFAPGVTSKVLTVRVWGDLADEADETYSVNLSNAVNGTVADGTGTGTIVDNDIAAVSISDVTVTEGDTGWTPANFTISLSAPSYQTVTVGWATANGTALAGPDYRAQTGIVTFSPGQTSRLITARVFGDMVSEVPEQFTVGLSNPVNGVIGDGSGTGAINDNDSTLR